MSETFDAFRYLGYLQSNWRVIAGTAGIAVGLALAASFALPRQYTATARVVIDPPAGADPRSAMTVSPIYFESLKTYEQFASSDSLFQKAAQRFQLTGGAVESLKRRVLKVELVRNTRIMEISATLPDAAKAQALAQFVAESTVNLNRASLSEGDRELQDGLQRQQNDVRANLQQIESEWTKSLSSEPVAALSAQLEESALTRSRLQEQMQTEEVEIAGLDNQLKTRRFENGKVENGKTEADARKEQSDAQARLAEMGRQIARLDRETAEREKIIGAREAHRNQLDAQRKNAQTSLAAIDAKLRDARSESGFRGERLQVIDPGIVPERPSSPNVPLNLAGALLAGLALPIVYLTLRMNFEERRVSSARGGLRTVARSRDE
jgi:uncharacterized protein involved in exopolysaccharide biosynthesis